MGGLNQSYESQTFFGDMLDIPVQELTQNGIKVKVVLDGLSTIYLGAALMFAFTISLIIYARLVK